MRSARRPSAVLIWLFAGLGSPVLLAEPADAADSRKCRATIAQQATKLTSLGLRLLDACHAQRGRGKRSEACLPLALSDAKGKLVAARAAAEKAVTRACAPNDVVRNGFPGGDVVAELRASVEAEITDSSRALQGSPALSGDREAARCHAAIGKARSALVVASLTRAVRCQKAIDRKATSFGSLADACVLDAGNTIATATRSIARACRRRAAGTIAGSEVQSCEPLPGCVVDAATATGQRIARATYGHADSCGDGIRAPGEACPRLEGEPAEPALAAVVTMDAEAGVPDGEVAESPSGARVARTRLELELAPAATVASVNALLADIGASILMSVEGVPILLVRIPDPGDLGALEQVLAVARAHPSVHTATAGFFPGTDLLPDNFDPAQDGGVALDRIDHQLAIRASSAWNARAAMFLPGERPLVVVGDIFGDGPPDAAVDAVFPSAADFASGNLSPSGHGYHVLGIVAAASGGAACTAPPPASAAVARGCATGTFPATLRVRAVDLQGGLVMAAARMRMILRLQTAPRAILSTSLNDCGLTCGNPLAAAEEGVKWVKLVRGAGLENRVLHLTSAGNIQASQTTVLDALTNSAFTAAALFDGGLFDVFGNLIPTLANVLVVENARNTTSPPYAPRCLDRSSKRGGHLAGIGSDVWSLRDAAGSTGICSLGGYCAQELLLPAHQRTSCTPGNSAPCQAGNKTGTSMATPQVAALAAYLWSLEPTLSVAELRALLLATATPPGNGGGAVPCDAAAPKPVVDAYAAALALDATATQPTPESAPVRHAILDADDDGFFSASDLGAYLERYLDGFTGAAAHGPPVVPASRDHGRFDLNGDGFTGGPGRVPFDLDLVGSPPLGRPLLGLVFQPLDDGAAALFEQDGVTDLEILCYYAHSALYAGAAEERAALLDPTLCSRVEIVHEVDADGVLLATVLVRDAHGVERPLPGVGVEVEVAGGEGGGSAVTDAAGQVVLQIGAPDGVTAEVTIAVRPEPDGLLLAESTLDWPPPTERIAFMREAPDPSLSGIYLMAPDGSDQRRISGLRTASPLRWSPDGTRLLAVVSQGGAQDVFVVNADGSGETQVTPIATYDTGPVWSPDGSRIAYRSWPGFGASTIVVMNADGSGAVSITDPAEVGSAQMPTWSPDGGRVAFVGQRPVCQTANPFCGAWIYTVNAGGGTASSLLPVGQFDTVTSYPLWAPGASVLWWSFDGGQLHLDANAVGNVPVADPEETVRSQDGSLIAFIGYLNGGFDERALHVMDTGGATTRVADPANFDRRPTFSPDGRRIAFQSLRNLERSNIYVMNTDGSDVRSLTSDPEITDTFPSWSPRQ